MSKINAGIAMVKVLESWGIDHIYGIPGGSFNSIMDALYQEKTTTFKFVMKKSAHSQPLQMQN